MRSTFLFIAGLIFIHFSSTAQTCENLRLKDYRPQSIFNIPVTKVEKAKFTAIDIHSHDYLTTDADIAKWSKLMDTCNIEKTIILTMATGSKFDSLYHLYSKYGNKFEIWCGFDYTGYDKPGFGASAIKELERCQKMGARGVGELGDKGLGELYSKPTPGKGLHLTDARMKPLFDKCAELNMPVNIHIAEPIWMYQKMDSTNDGLMNGYAWRIDLTQPDILGFDKLIQSLEATVKMYPKTTFIACHYANLMHDLNRMGVLLDKYPNLYADISARLAETATVPIYMNHFMTHYQDKLLFGTDNNPEHSMYELYFRVLETADEHFYAIDMLNYHWPLYGFHLNDDVLRKLYHDNAFKLLNHN